MNALIAKKVGMTQIYDNDSKSIAVTVLDVSSCRAVQIKSIENDGYNAVQLTIGKSKKNNKAISSHYQNNNVEPGEGLWEVLIEEDTKIIPGEEINAGAILQPGNLVDITGTSKGKGFSGVMKRHNFAGQKASHGVHKVHRAGGSIGNASFPGHVFKGTKMAGRMGKDRTTIQNIQVVAIDDKKNFILVNGSVPGANGSVVFVSKAVKVTLDSQKDLSKKYASKVFKFADENEDSYEENVDKENIAYLEEE